jgi:EAL domain-containing protein (putative c-di-GMP-specific phosphodiesterase class I)
MTTAGKRTLAHEVLVRMRDEHDELIMPGGFLAAAERFGLARDIDRWVIDKAVDLLVDRRRQDPRLCLSINLAAQTLSDSGICEFVRGKVSASGLAPAALIFEVTETAAIAELGVAKALLSQLREMGCRTALDDFGSGMSSFAYLRDLPVDLVKIDGRFVRHMSESPVDAALVKAMNDIAHALGKETVAEFVENERALRMIVDMGVDYAQGFHLGVPRALPDGLVPGGQDPAHAAVPGGGISAARQGSAQQVIPGVLRD